MVDIINGKLAQKVDKVNDRSVGQVLELLHVVVSALKSRMHRAMRDGDDGASDMAAIAGMEARTLGFFAHHPSSTQGELVRHSGRDKGQIARIVKHLRELELLEQVEDPDDRRNVRLRVTPRGEQLHREVHRRRKRAGVQALAGFDAKELATLAAILERMRLNLE